jgi:hypothetical protein
MSPSASAWSAFVPWLVLVWVLLGASRRRGPAAGLVCGVVAAVLVAVPWWGHPLPWWSRALLANFSVPLAGLLAVAVASRVLRRPVFPAPAWRAAWVFGASASLLLYPSALGLGPGSFDAYALGWPWLFWGQSGVLFVGVSLWAALLLWRGNGFGIMLLAALLGHAAGFQESRNLWDYLIDPAFGVASIVAVLWMLARRLRLRSRGWRG